MTAELYDAWIALQEFLERGGGVLRIILVVTFVMWIMILERFLYLRTGHRTRVGEAVSAWKARRDRSSWYAHQIRRSLLSSVRQRLELPLGLIQALVAVCPLLGLLGTVTGMIEVFEVMAITGSSNARAMAGGVSRATIPTMAGMVVAISGLYFSFRLQQRAESERKRVAELLTLSRRSSHAA